MLISTLKSKIAYAKLTHKDLFYVGSITIDNQGAGYTNVPNIYIMNDPRDTTGSGASAVATLTGAGTVTQLVITNIGNPNTTLFPTISFSSGSAAATPIIINTTGQTVYLTALGSWSAVTTTPQVLAALSDLYAVRIA